jgi:hypothetical protein
VIDRVELRGVIDVEWLSKGLAAARPGNLFPSRVARNAASMSDSFLNVLNGSLVTGYRPRRIELVQAPKWDTTTRPAADMPLADEVIYTTLVEYLKERAHPGLVAFTGINGEGQSYRDFEQYPLTVAGAQYVLEADAASFYEYVDHERLASELVGLTGEALVADALLNLLESWLGSQRGLPQGPSASAVLADIYISPVQRALARAGFELSRYSDDFKVVAGTWDDVRRAQLLLESAMRDVGLVVAAGKLRTPGIERYRQLVELMEKGEDEYATEEAVPTDLDIESVVQTIQECVNDPRVTIEWTRLIRRALSNLGRAHSERALPFIPRLLNRYPHATQHESAYLESLMGGPHEDAALNTVEGWLRSAGFRHSWQIGWILHSAAFAETARGDLGRWVAPVLFNDSFPWFVRGQAAISLAVHGKLPSQDTYFNVYEAAPEATKPDLVVAVLIGAPRWKNSFLAGIRTTPLLEATAQLDASQYRTWI